MNSNGIVWNVDTEVSGTFLRLHVDNVKLDALEGAAGYKATGPHAYYDDEAGYDGWELRGTFNGHAFNLYTRFGNLRIGGRDGLDVAALEAAIRGIR